MSRGGGAFGAAIDDYSFYGCRNYFVPYGKGGKHEIECFANAASADFDPNPIVTAAVSARFTGSAPSGLNVESGCTVGMARHALRC